MLPAPTLEREPLPKVPSQSRQIRSGSCELASSPESEPDARTSLESMLAVLPVGTCFHKMVFEAQHRSADVSSGSAGVDRRLGQISAPTKGRDAGAVQQPVL